MDSKRKLQKSKRKTKRRSKVKKKAKATKRKAASKPKKTSTYDKTKNVGLKPHKFSKIKQEFHDIDYAHKLNAEDADWMSRFMQEDLGARMNHPGKKIYKKKKDILECYRRNNKRNFDMFSLAKATKLVNQDDLEKYIHELQETVGPDASEIEDRLIEELDKKRNKKD